MSVKTEGLKKQMHDVQLAFDDLLFEIEQGEMQRALSRLSELNALEGLLNASAFAMITGSAESGEKQIAE
ncbi:MAG: hypothetical protein MJ193_03595 [Clostridia bacterium]|nr:hypothetical protein [Clostridia bacterium]